MQTMKQNAFEITLRDYMERDDGWGHEEGQEVYKRLLKALDSQPTIDIFKISLKGVIQTDASFPRESVMELIKRFRGKKGVCLVHFENQDLLDNWDAAAQKKEQPVIVWDNDHYKILGPRPSTGNKKIFEYAMSFSCVTASEAAKALDLKIANASTKLKQLADYGFLLRKEEASPSGGKEFFYFRIR